MAQTIRTEYGTGSPEVYDVDFDLGYLDKSDIYVYIGENYLENNIPFIWINNNQIQCTVDSKVEFIIRRAVPRNKAVNDYSDGAIMRELNLDASFAQALMILEEMDDGFVDRSGTLNLINDLDMHKFKILNLAEADTDMGAPNWGQVRELYAVVLAEIKEIEARTKESEVKAEGYSVDARDSQWFANQWAVKMDNLVDDSWTDPDYSSKWYAGASKEAAAKAKADAEKAEKSSKESKKQSDESTKQAKEATKQAKLASKYQAEMAEIYLNIRSDFPSGYPMGAWMLHDGTLSIAGNYVYLGVDMDINNGWFSITHESIDLTDYMRNDITVGPVITITSPEWYGEQGVGFQCMASPDSLGTPFRGEYFYLNKTNARNQMGGSVWSATTNTIRDTYIGEVGVSSSYLTWKKMLHEGCETLEGQLPTTSINLTGTQTHLDTLKSPQICHQDRTSEALISLGYPFQEAGTLEVLYGAGALQTYTQYHAPFKVARRSYVANVWGDWVIEGEDRPITKAGTLVHIPKGLVKGMNHHWLSLKFDGKAGDIAEVTVIIYVNDQDQATLNGSIIWDSQIGANQISYKGGVTQVILHGLLPISQYVRPSIYVNAEVLGNPPYPNYFVSTTIIVHPKAKEMSIYVIDDGRSNIFEQIENNKGDKDDESINDITAFGSIGRM